MLYPGMREKYLGEASLKKSQQKNRSRVNEDSFSVTRFFNVVKHFFSLLKKKKFRKI
jgi:hypothetical protein